MNYVTPQERNDFVRNCHKVVEEWQQALRTPMLRSIV